MKLYRIRKVDFQHKDERGSLTQLIHDGYKQVNVLESKAGAVRGAHFHKKAIEAFFLISGSAEVEFKRETEEEKIVFKRGEFFEIPPFVLHSMHFPEECLMVQMYDIPVENEDGTKDIFMEDDLDARDKEGWKDTGKAYNT